MTHIKHIALAFAFECNQQATRHVTQGCIRPLIHDTYNDTSMKRRKTKAEPASPLQRFSRLSPQGKRRLLLRSAAVLGVAGVSAGSLARYDSRKRVLHDLTIIGDGAPAVVQIHDPGCQTCRRLKSRTLVALEDLPHVRFRLADILTGDGKALQDRFNAQTITLLLFEPGGKLVDRIVGLQDIDRLRHRFGQAFAPTA